MKGGDWAWRRFIIRGKWGRGGAGLDIAKKDAECSERQKYELKLLHKKVISFAIIIKRI